jgi:hypothetical protein
MKLSIATLTTILSALASAAPPAAPAIADAGTASSSLLTTRQSTPNATCANELDALRTCQDNLASDLATCQTQAAAGSPFEDYTRCPRIHDQTTAVDGVTYRQRCNQGIASGTTVLRSEDLRYDACLAACSADRRCQGVNFWPANDRPCLMFSQYNSNWGTAGSQYIVIGALPTQRR